MLTTRQVNNKLTRIDSLCGMIATGLKLDLDVTAYVTRAQELAFDIEKAGLPEVAQSQRSKITQTAYDNNIR